MALVLQGGPDGTKEGTANAMALAGAKQACVAGLPADQGYKYRSCTLHTLTPASETQGAYSGLIPSKANENDFMMAMGYFPSKAIQTAANANGDKLFAIADFEFTPPVGNIVSVMYSEDQIGYLAGLLAGEVAKTRGGKVAVIGGVDQPSVRRQVNGFGSGARISCPTCKAYGLYAGTFDSDAKLSSTVGDILKDKKVSVVFNAASIFGTMTLKNLTVQQGVYGIGSGSDEWITNWAYGSVPGSEHILTSIQTDYSVLVRSVMQSVLHANLTGGSTVFFGVNPDARHSAIKLAPVHEAEGVFTKEIQKKMEGYVADMARGKLMTGVDHKNGESRNSGASSTSVELLALTKEIKGSDRDANNSSNDDEGDDSNNIENNNEENDENKLPPLSSASSSSSTSPSNSGKKQTSSAMGSLLVSPSVLGELWMQILLAFLLIQIVFIF
ncbi:hypothetical protein BGZ65_007152 [Modicella reniformis]|uniref:ABC transporter substrate-binding protein PnrA-like domain-containing protein n=1 Tax=Modicella reniformis TaxID=1440133 RepID=A0A9P6SSW3_9FUNG|nr:hypothetical protein BGZ65_007152 [Modicella reniformis]